MFFALSITYLTLRQSRWANRQNNRFHNLTLPLGCLANSFIVPYLAASCAKAEFVKLQKSTENGQL